MEGSDKIRYFLVVETEVDDGFDVGDCRKGSFGQENGWMLVPNTEMKRNSRKLDLWKKIKSSVLDTGLEIEFWEPLVHRRHLNLCHWMRSLTEKVLVELKRGLAVSLGKEKEQQWGKRKPGEGEVTEPREEKVSKRVCLVASYAVSIKWEKDRRIVLAMQKLWETLTKGVSV